MKQGTGDFLANHQRNRRDWVKETCADVTAAVKKEEHLSFFQVQLPKKNKKRRGVEFWGVEGSNWIYDQDYHKMPNVSVLESYTWRLSIQRRSAGAALTQLWRSCWKSPAGVLLGGTGSKVEPRCWPSPSSVNHKCRALEKCHLLCRLLRFRF